MNAKRIFLIVLDSLGIGAMPDADAFGDEGANTLETIRASRAFSAPNLERLGLFHIDGVRPSASPGHAVASYARLSERARGKDTTTGHWEMAGCILDHPFPVYPNGFPFDVIDGFERLTGYGTLCNKPYSGTQVILDYGQEHVETGKLIVYTSADSVFQVAAHEDIVSLAELYRCCGIARNMLKGEHAVGRVIARPFVGGYPDFTRTPNRHDYSLPPPHATMLDILKGEGMDVIGVGKIEDIFAGQGITQAIHTTNNADGMAHTLALAQQEFHGLCFVNLVDFDMLYGHRNDADGYAGALSQFDTWLDDFIPNLRQGDVLIITADHGCDPGAPGTDHTREYVPMLIYGENIRPDIDLGTRTTFSDIAATCLHLFACKERVAGNSFAEDVWITAN